MALCQWAIETCGRSQHDLDWIHSEEGYYERPNNFSSTQNENTGAPIRYDE